MQETIPKMFKEIVGQNLDQVVQYSKEAAGKFQPTTYRRLYDEVRAFACGLLEVGIKRGDHVGMISDNRKEWLIADLSLLSIGAADVPRSCDTMAQELRYILGFADCESTFVENEEQLRKILSIKRELPTLKRVIVFDPDFDPAAFSKEASGWKLYRFGEVMEKGEARAARDPELFAREMEKGQNQDLATIIFTSGTTGEPKGVMLSHNNFLYQVSIIPGIIFVYPGDIWLSVLPVWHSFERIMQYVALGTASALAYSKPIGKIMLADIEAVRPTWMASVPRIWEAIMDGVYRNVNAQAGVKKALFHFFVGAGKAYAHFSYMFRGLLPRFTKRSRLLDLSLSLLPLILLTPLRLLGNLLVFNKIKQKLGGRFVAGVSGGGALPPAVDTFFSAAGILLLEGYGLTETAPVTNVRHQKHPVFGTIGPMIPGTEGRVLDENGQLLPAGQKGVLYIRGPQVMLGYYKKPDLTAKMISPDGWLNTGDLAMFSLDGEIKILGRAKDTIVLRGGENVEPSPIEAKLQESPYIEQVVVLGQDQKFLAALIVPNMERLEEYAKANAVPYLDREELVESPEIGELVSGEVHELVSKKNGFRGFERIFRFKLLPKSFALGRELSHKLEVKRHAVAELYKKEIAELFR